MRCPIVWTMSKVSTAAVYVYGFSHEHIQVAGFRASAYSEFVNRGSLHNCLDRTIDDYVNFVRGKALLKTLFLNTPNSHQCRRGHLYGTARVVLSLLLICWTANTPKTMSTSSLFIKILYVYHVSCFISSNLLCIEKPKSR